MNFHYRAKSTSGVLSTGVVEATSPAEARRLLREKSLFALEVSSSSVGVARGGTSARRSFGASSKVTKSDLLTFTTQLSIMCRSGIDLAEAFRNVAADCRKPALREVILSVYDDVAGGSSVSAAMQRRSDVFGEAYTASIAAGEASGRVTDVLAQLAELLKKEIQLRNTLRGVLAYPCVLLGVACLVVGALVFFVLPQFGKVFETLETPAPPMTRMLLEGATVVRGNWPWLAILGVASVVGGLAFRRTETCRRLVDGLIVNAPLLRTATRPLLTGRSFRLVGTLLQSGLPLLEAIRLARRSAPNARFREFFGHVESEILLGHGMGGSLRETDLVPPGAVQLVTTAERSGTLGPVMQIVGEFYEEEGEREIRQRAKLLEPMIIVLMGAVVAFVVASVMLPLLDVTSGGAH